MTSRRIFCPPNRLKPSPGRPCPTGRRDRVLPIVAQPSSKATHSTPITSSTPTTGMASSGYVVMVPDPRSPTRGSPSIRLGASSSPSSVPCATVAPCSRSRRAISCVASRHSSRHRAVISPAIMGSSRPITISARPSFPLPVPISPTPPLAAGSTGRPPQARVRRRCPGLRHLRRQHAHPRRAPQRAKPAAPFLSTSASPPSPRSAHPLHQAACLTTTDRASNNSAPTCMSVCIPASRLRPGARAP